mgnify:CR=1 FL=1
MTRTIISILLFGLVLLVTGCREEPNVSQPEQVIDRAALIRFNQEKAANERSYIDSIAASRRIDGLPFYNELTTGLRIWSEQPLTNVDQPVQLGDTVTWTGEMMLTDSTVLLRWPEGEPFQFIWKKSQWPAGFHELAQNLQSGQEVECIIPSHMGWGLSGWPPLIPQDAVLWLRVKQTWEVPPVETSAQSGGRLAWNSMLDELEQGHWPGDENWIEYKRLAASPCMAWYDAQDLASFESVPQRLHIDLKTLHLKEAGGELLDMGVTSWDFAPDASGQLLPVLADLQRLYPVQKKWACWCPVDIVFDEASSDALGLASNGVVGFQWELSDAELVNAQ